MNKELMQIENQYLYFALVLSIAPAKYILESQLSSITTLKSDNSVVTEADQLAEKIMRNLIEEKYPTHSILGEEFEEKKGTDEFQWVLDPIDGTYSYSIGLPKFGTLVGLLLNGKPLLGVIHLPITNETLYAEIGKGCWYVKGDLPSKRVWVDSKVREVSCSTVSLSGVDCSELREGMHPSTLHLRELINNAGSLEFIGDCVQHMNVAKGKLHVA